MGELVGGEVECFCCCVEGIMIWNWVMTYDDTMIRYYNNLCSLLLI